MALLSWLFFFYVDTNRHMTEQLTNLTHLHSETGPAFILVFVLFDSDSLDIILLFVSVCLCASYYYVFVTLFSFLFQLFLAFILR